MSEQLRAKILAAFEAAEKTRGLETLVGTCGFYKAVSVIPSGAFLYCGLPKDLFVPIGEQIKLMKAGESYIVRVYRDEKRGLIAGSSRLNKYLDDKAPESLKEGNAVDLLIYARTPMGYKAVVNHGYWGLIYQNEIFQELLPGQKIQGYIKRIRPDGRIDLSLHQPGYEGVPGLAEKILHHLKTSGGRSHLTDQTPPEEIYRLFGVSKKKFKMAVGNLYKQRKLVLERGGIRINDEGTTIPPGKGPGKDLA